MIVDPGELHAKLHGIHYDISISPRFDEFKQLKEVLGSSKSSLKLWQDKWLPDDSDLKTSFHRNWDKGRDKVQELLAALAETVELLKDAVNDAEVDSGHAKLGRKPVRRLFVLDRPKKPQVSPSTSRSALDVALELCQAIDRLWIHSEILYDFYHGRDAPRDGSSATEEQISRSIYVRNGAIALYQACQRSTKHCALDLDLLRNRAVPTDPQEICHSFSHTNLFYHILVGSAIDPKVDVWDVAAESLDEPEAVAIAQNIKVYKEPDLAVFESAAPSNSHVIGIQADYSRENFYFRVAAAHTAAGSISECEGSALPLKGNRRSTDMRPLQSLTIKAKMDLAYDLVQCGFYLLGTPWLASLSSENVCRIEIDERRLCVLKVEPMPLHHFVLESPIALSEGLQLLQIGIVLIDIALDGLGAWDLAKVSNPRLWATKKLPLVYEALGPSYFRACAFCVLDQRSIGIYHRHEKYRYPSKTRWKWHLEDLLRQYHVHVVSR